MAEATKQESRHSALLLQASATLSRKLQRITFSKEIYVYNVLDYAWGAWQSYIRSYADPALRSPKFLLLGINPGPHGMAQTGIPFGNIHAVRNYLALDFHIKQPKRLHPRRPVHGLNYHREEASGKRLWGCIASLFPDPEVFFKHAFVLNFCPLAFFDASGKNLTPDALRHEKSSVQKMEACCLEHLQVYCSLLRIDSILAIGKYAYKMAEKQSAIRLPIQYIPHPSPLNPKHREFNRSITALFNRLR